MSNFLAGVVCRGAGLPSPVTMRPATGPRDLPLAIPSAAAPEAQQELRDASPVGRDITLEPLARPKMTQSSEPVLPVAARPSFAEASREMSPSPPEPRKVWTEPVSVAKKPIRVTPRSETVPDPTGKIHPAPSRIETIQPMRETQAAQSDPAPVASTTLLPAPPAMWISAPAPPKNTEHRSEPGIAVQPSTKTSSPALERAPQESRNIQVKIGKVEIRSSQPTAPAPSARPRAKGGFDDFALARTYLDRGHR